MIRQPSKLRSAAIAAANMSHTPNLRGRRNYCDNRTPAFVSPEEQFSAMRNDNVQNYNAVPPPTHFYNQNQFSSNNYNQNQNQFRPQQQMQHQVYGSNNNYNNSYNQNQFRPRQQMGQQFRPRQNTPQDYRVWEFSALVPPTHCERFTVLSYNILADYLANDHYQQLYSHIPHYMLDWNWRKRSLCFELGLWSADIMCFQEVDRFQDIEAELKQRGYNGIWKMRTGDPVDGCAIFWRESKFKMLHEESIEYNKLGLRDNVAQICVFESLNRQNNSNSASSLPSSSTNHQRVVVCNIHVLFNPKRGDIKLGQIRVLLDRANAVSKLWDDAPVVLCGDFNCTPNSPMYNYITKQKLDLSELPRHMVSGQVSAEIRPPRASVLPYFRTQPADFSLGSGSLNGHPRSENASTTTATVASDKIVSPEPSSEDVLSESNGDKICVNSDSETVSVANAALEEDFECLSVNDSVDRTQPADFSLGSGSLHGPRSENASMTTATVASDTIVSSEPSSEDVLSESNGNKISVNPNSETVSVANVALEEDFERLSVNDSVDGTKDENEKDRNSSFSRLHSTGQSPSDSNSSPENSPGNEILKENEQFFDERKLPYNPGAWTPMEIETATGSAERTVVEHPLKLTSSYTEAKNSSGSRDANGEPLVTSYHRRFLGTVDYIWHSEGLQTARVLAPIPKHVMQQTRGFPTKKWGSDHIALVSEFAFVQEVTSTSTS